MNHIAGCSKTTTKQNTVPSFLSVAFLTGDQKVWGSITTPHSAMSILGMDMCAISLISFFISLGLKQSEAIFLCPS
jgi:multisubunit Na+/H+ antiporter MnhF subunit